MNFIRVGNLLVNLNLVTVMDYGPLSSGENPSQSRGTLKITGVGGTVEIEVSAETFANIATFVRENRPAFQPDEN